MLSVSWYAESAAGGVRWIYPEDEYHKCAAISASMYTCIYRDINTAYYF